MRSAATATATATATALASALEPYTAIRTRGSLAHAGLLATLLRVAKSSSLGKSVFGCSPVFVESAEPEHIQLITGYHL